MGQETNRYNWKYGKFGGNRSGLYRQRNELTRVLCTFSPHTTIPSSFLPDKSGNALMWASSGGAGFRRCKKREHLSPRQSRRKFGGQGTKSRPERNRRGSKRCGSGRESAIRGFISRAQNISSIRDATPVSIQRSAAQKAAQGIIQSLKLNHLI